MDEELKALMVVKKELVKIRDKYSARAVKERTKVNDVYVTVQGEKCYSEQDVFEWYQSDYITSSQYNRYVERLNAKKSKAGQIDVLTKSELICKIFDNTISNLTTEINDLQYRIEQEQKRQERWLIAQQQGCSYQQWLDLEEISRQSEEQEKFGISF